MNDRKNNDLNKTHASFTNMVHYLYHSFIHEAKALIHLNDHAVTLYPSKATQAIDKELKDKRIALIKQRNELYDSMEDFDEDSEQYKRLKHDSDKISRKIKKYQPVKLDPHTPGYVLAQGGSKQVFTLDDKHVISVVYNGRAFDGFNYTYDDLESVWKRMVHEEVVMSSYLKKLGIETQDYQESSISHEGHTLPVLITTSFLWLEQNGTQVRGDHSNAKCYGSSMLFGSAKNITSEHLLNILNRPCESIITLIMNRVEVNNDSIYLAIQDSPDTPPDSAGKAALYSDLNQRVNLYLYDFSWFKRPLQQNFNWESENGVPTIDEIRVKARSLLNHVMSILTTSLTPEELKKINKELNCNPKDNTIVKMILDEYHKIKDGLIEDMSNKIYAKLSEQALPTPDIKSDEKHKTKSASSALASQSFISNINRHIKHEKQHRNSAEANPHNKYHCKDKDDYKTPDQGDCKNDEKIHKHINKDKRHKSGH